MRENRKFERGAGGKFLPGSGGRPKGSKNVAAKNALRSVRALGPQAIERLTEAMNNGERWAIELVINHILPKDRTVEMHGVESEDIAEAIANGDIAPSEARDIVYAMSKVSEFNEIEPIQNLIDITILETDRIEDAENKYKLLIGD